MTPKKPKAASRQDNPGRDEVLEQISAAIVAKRDEAIAGRKQSGIEEIWLGDGEFYEGYDDANRHEFKSALMTKPTEGGRSTETPKKRKGSTLFPNITAPYVDTAAAKMGDMLMGAADWRPFAVKPTPIPDLLKGPPETPSTPAQGVPGAMAAAPPPMVPPGAGAAALPMAQPNAAQAIMANPAAPGTPVDPLEALMAKIKAVRAEALQAAEKAEDSIDDALVECQFEDEMRDVIHDSSRLGTGIIKGPVPEKRKTRAVRKDEKTGEYTLVVDVELKPVSKRVNPWNLYPDYPACGEDIHNGNFILEFSPCTEKQLRALQGGEGPAAYLDDQIKKCIDEGPGKSTVDAGGVPVPKENFPRWFFYGVLKASELAAAGCTCPEDKSDDELIPIIATIVNDRVIKVALNPLEANEFPYDFLVWKARAGMPWGVGVTRQARTGQRIATAGLRNLMDNAGASAKPHKVMTDTVEQDGDPWTWRASSDTTDVRGAMQFFVQPNLQQELEAIIALGRQQIELETGLPMTVLGMQGSVEETAKGRTILNNNGSTVLRRIARNYDAAIEAHVRRYYAWLMLYSDDESAKGDMQIQARGSSSLVERDLQSQALPGILQMCKDPAFEMSPIKARDEWLRSLHFDPSNFEMDEKEKAAMKTRQPPPDPRVQAAEIKKDADIQTTQLHEAGETQRTQIEQQGAAADRVQESHENEANRQLQLVLGQVKERIESIKDQGAREIAFGELKAMLAGITIKVQAQRDLSPQGKGPQVLAAPDEPAGRAPAGEAFAK
jgi:hypothetical protein